MKQALNCEQMRLALDSAFDKGLELDSSAAAHVENCPACAAYGDALAALDLSLQQAPAIQPAHALVARIQAEIATQPRHAFRPWIYPVGVAAAVLLLAALGPVLNGILWIPTMGSGSWLPRPPILPEWDFVEQEITGIPAGVAGDFATLGQWSESAWASVNGWLSAFGSGYSPWVWTLFVVCVAAACALDGMEWMSRRIHRS